MRNLIMAFLLLSAALPGIAADPVFPYGAVYFRKSNPPADDWERDHETAARIGMNVMRHWYMWSAIEIRPGTYDWRDYDRIMEL
jgi:beta-galactosidase